MLTNASVHRVNTANNARYLWTILVAAYMALILTVPLDCFAQADDDDDQADCTGLSDGSSCERNGCSGDCLNQVCHVCDATIVSGNSCGKCGLFGGVESDGSDDCSEMYHGDGTACVTTDNKDGKCKTSEGSPPSVSCVPNPTPTPSATPTPKPCGSGSESHSAGGCPEGQICCFQSRDPLDSSKICVAITNSCPANLPCVRYLRDGNCPCLELVTSDGGGCTSADGKAGSCQSRSCVEHTPTPTPSATASAARSATPASSVSATPIKSPSRTATPAVSASRTPTPGATLTRSSTPISSPSRSATPAASPSRSATAIASATFTAKTPTPIASVSRSATPLS